MQNQLATMLEEAGREIEACATANDILNTKAKYLGKKSLLNGLYGRMKDLEPSERPAFGNLLNEARQQLETLLNAKSSAIKAQSWKKENTDMDFSMPGMPSSRGGYHPLSIVRRQIDEVFISLGFEIAEGLDIEDEFHNFDALNTPADHPSRNLADTFYVEGGRLLRTQTS
ncbi:MAG: phenylalanine--tRNA ligase subunit alpha, partial [Candidatus Cloacimonetes bacterium]|nr:phenylalanine--tRNA ligase subunit alpha [Candidatus Cloacimonadota bacterium]